MKRAALLAIMPICLTILSGCAEMGSWSSWNPVRQEQVVADTDPVLMRLAEAADRASAALQAMAAVEQARTPVRTAEPGIEHAPAELRQAITVTWTGPVEPIARLLADRAGYSFSAIGAMPPVPVVVNVNAMERPVVDVLRDIGLQVGARADLVVDAGRRVVEVRYAPAAGR